jgi:hypothetical protein
MMQYIFYLELITMSVPGIRFVRVVKVQLSCYIFYLELITWQLLVS